MRPAALVCIGARKMLGVYIYMYVRGRTLLQVWCGVPRHTWTKITLYAECRASGGRHFRAEAAGTHQPPGGLLPPPYFRRDGRRIEILRISWRKVCAEAPYSKKVTHTHTHGGGGGGGGGEARTPPPKPFLKITPAPPR